MALLLERRSIGVAKLGDPGPNDADMDTILRAASRVPDHRKLTPWRFILFKGDAREHFGAILRAAFGDEISPLADEERLLVEGQRFLRAPVVVAAISSVKHDAKQTPEWEQLLSMGAACQNMVLSAQALGFGANWLTEWCAYSPRVMQALGMAAHERVAGFIYIGTALELPGDRERPALSQIVTTWAKSLDQITGKGQPLSAAKSPPAERE